jgi:hypothetical protein
MSLTKLTLKPGIDKQNTEYGAEGGWIDCDYVRFRYGQPEKIGGWTKFPELPQYLIGAVTEVYMWKDLNGSPYVIAGTNRKLYIASGGLWYDVTPVRATSSAGDVTFSATSGSAVITVSHTDHGALQNDFVTFSGATALGGDITAELLNAEYEVLEVVDNDTYKITASTAATASDTGNGGVSVVGEYQIHVGPAVSYFDYGFGTGTWGAYTWDTARPDSVAETLFSRVWQFDQYGEDMVCQLCEGPTYYWDASSGVTTRAAPVSNGPTKSQFALVSTPDRHLVVFGTETTIGTASTQDPMFVRFSDQENITEWTETVENTAGGQSLTDGNRIISAIRSRGQILIFTDTSVHGMQYIGPPYTFGFNLLGVNCGILGPHAAVDVNGLAFWMGPEAFYVFDGTVKKLPCSVQDYVYDDLNLIQSNKVHVGLNSQFNEITWWYCTYESDYIDRCVTYNYVEDTWHIGTMARTSWADLSAYPFPIATEYLPTSTQAPPNTIYGVTEGRTMCYQHEEGTNADGSPITAYIESAYFDIAEGDSVLLMKRVIPDIKDQTGNVELTLNLRTYPHATEQNSPRSPFTIEPTTLKLDTRARGRQVSVKLRSDEADTNWRYGTLRVDIQPDGMR